MNTELLITNVLFTISILVSLSLGILVFIKRPKKAKRAPNTVFLFTSIALCIWQISYVLGINISDPELSRFIFMFNIAALLTAILNADTILRVTGRYEKQKHVMRSLYSLFFILALFFALFPDQYMRLPEPKLYFANYFIAGDYYFLDNMLFFGVIIYMFAQIYAANKTADFREKKRLSYFTIAIIYSYSVGSIAEFLLYGINIDPIPATIIGLYTIPMAYGIIKYDLISVNVLAKRAFGYAVSVGSLMLFILLIGYLNTSLVTSFPGFPIWLIPLLSAVIAIGAGATVWKKVQEMEYLKYQFVDVVTHKFRTPLTHIGWSIDTLKASAKTAEDREAVEAIKSANDKLFELTNTLVGMSAAESSQYLYNFTSLSADDLIHTTHESILDRAKAKHMNIRLDIPQHIPKIWADINRFQFVLQTVFDNAVSYSQDGSAIVISAMKNNGFVWIRVQDHGIGIDAKDIPHMFTKFFRTDKAKRADTEGMGVGLYLSKEIMHRLGGDIFVKSEGLNRGATFTVKVPIDRSGQ